MTKITTVQGDSFEYDDVTAVQLEDGFFWLLENEDDITAVFPAHHVARIEGFRG